MKKFLLSVTFLGIALLANAAKDPVIMKINGKDVKLSEFQYLYQKNNLQQIEKESLEQYVDRFVVYKLKVEEALSQSIDTTAAFKKEFSGYKKDLVKPYLEDSTVTKQLALEAYERMQKNRDVTNIYLRLGNDEASKIRQKQKADSLYQCLLNGEKIEDLAYKHSEDIYAKERKGHLGFIKAGTFPYVFEKTAYDTPIGKFSKPFQSKVGWHILQVNGEREDQGKVSCAHILKLYPQGADAKTKEEVMAKAKEILKRLKEGANFEELAKIESEDPGSAKNGGHLRSFGSGEMVPEFEKAAFALKNGQLSEPVITQYGVHIIKKFSSMPLGSFEKNERIIKSMINRDERADMGKDAKMDQLRKEFKYKENKKLYSFVEEKIKEANGNDSIFIASLKDSNIEAFRIKGRKVYLHEIANGMRHRATTSAQGEMMAVKNAVELNAEAILREKYIDELYKKDTYFRNLLNEYRDGMLLFEVSNKRIWEGASKDKEGLEKYFQENKDKYTWKKPKFKGIIILSVNDSIQQLAKSLLAADNSESTTKLENLKKELKNKISIERVLDAEGENPAVDYLVFKKGEKPKVKRFTECFVYEGRLIDNPENANDEKMAVTSDYQAQLEKEWVEYLKSKYKVEIKEKVLKKVNIQ